MSVGFALLRAPQVVQTLILNICNPQEIFILSLCSKRAYNLVRVHRKKPEKGELTVLEGESSLLMIKYPDEKCSSNYELTSFDGTPMNKLMGLHDISYMSNVPDHAENINIGGTTFSAAIDSNGLLVSFWKNRVHGAKTVIEYVTGLFNMSIGGFSINKASLCMIDWVNSRQESLKKATVFEWNPVFSDAEVQHILTDCKPTEELNLLIEPPPNFRFIGEFQKPSVLTINPSYWVTLDNLKTMDSINIHLEDSHFTFSNMNLFLKHWLAGGSPRLSFMKVDLIDMASNELFEDLMEAIVHVPETRHFIYLDGTVQSFCNAYDIQRNDGVKASVLLSQQWNRYLYMFVWPATE